MTDTRATSESPSFKKITYDNQKEINYLSDLTAIGPQYVSFLESLNYTQVDSRERSHFDNIADDLYKKIVKQGYLERPSKVSRKSKKGESDFNYYNSNDAFIDDEECCIEKKDKTSVFEDYQAVPVNSLEQLYASPAYTKRVEQIIVEIGKRKAPEQFSLVEEHDLEKFDAMRKNIKMSLLNRTRNETPGTQKLQTGEEKVKAAQQQPESKQELNNTSNNAQAEPMVAPAQSLVIEISQEAELEPPAAEPGVPQD